MTVRRPPTRVGGALSCAGFLGLLGLAGCSAPAAEPAATATAASTSAIPAPITPAPTTPAPTTPPPVFAVPGSCAQLVTVAQVTDALGVRLPGTSTFLLGEAQPDIGRTARVTCGYGVAPATDTAGASDPLLEVTVFVYTDAEAAADRVRVLVADQEQRGVRVDPATVVGADAVLLGGPADTTLVATVAERTYALTLLPGLLDPAGTQAALQTLADDAISAGAPGSASGAPTGSPVASPAEPAPTTD